MRQVNNSPDRNQTSDLKWNFCARSGRSYEQSNQDTKVNPIAGAQRLASHCHNDLAGLGLPTSFLQAQSTALNRELVNGGAETVNVGPATCGTQFRPPLWGRLDLLVQDSDRQNRANHTS